MVTLAQIERIDRAYDNIFRIGRAHIERTKTNKEMLQIEELYLPKFERIFRSIVKEYGDHFHLLHEAEKRYGVEIKTLIKSMVTKIYLLGLDYVARATNSKHLMFLSTNDINQIIIQSNESYRAFWRLVTKYLQVLKNRNVTKTTKISIKTAQSIFNEIMDIDSVMLTDEMMTVSDWEDTRLLDTKTNAALIINGIATTILAIATMEKYKELKAEKEEMMMIEEQGKTLFQEEYTGELMQEEIYPFGLDEEQAPHPPATGDKVVWATEKDEKVCDICSVLEGTEWDIDDPSIMIPRQDSHPHCRCRLLLVIDDEIMVK